MIELIAIDLDGTLLDDQIHVSKANIAAINQAISRGIHIVVCTGRPYAGMKHFIESFEYPAESPYYLILGNGTTIRQGPELSILNQHKLTDETLNKAITLFHNQPDIPLKLAGLTDFHFYGLARDDIPEILIQDAYKNKMLVEPISLDAFTSKLSLNKIMLMAESQILDTWEDDLTQIFKDDAETVRSTPIIFEVLPKSINKGKSLTWLSHHLNISMENIAVIGDELNDESMFEVAGMKIAMHNGHKKIKQMSDIIVPSNNESGVAEAIMQIIT
ncbi:HAD family phosphatase [Aerococcaceae bacterium DSM 111020]|nr:HAD family phosphatase [Aerococcaceae bacterium DSM 111020]